MDSEIEVSDTEEIQKPIEDSGSDTDAETFSSNSSNNSGTSVDLLATCDCCALQPHSPAPPPFLFTAVGKINFVPDDNSSILQYLENFIEHIIVETDRYTKQQKNQKLVPGNIK
ncbi:hypothetical protein Zmor_006068 [Zophobas morio]|uniref:Uncharacterized protein n=1 Tax=Zophobas morio TaxID=2755281 RepID=A0AA38IU76_9CUCU|nr:hypothetical protein Zmor_006068 [Zophobas morio]